MSFLFGVVFGFAWVVIGFSYNFWLHLNGLLLYKIINIMRWDVYRR
jgi:hypothetical protein